MRNPLQTYHFGWALGYRRRGDVLRGHINFRSCSWRVLQRVPVVINGVLVCPVVCLCPRD